MTERPLLEVAKDRSFTPGRRDVAPLLGLLGALADENDAKEVERALLRGPADLIYAAGAAMLPAALRPLRARLVALLARLEGTDPVQLRELLLAHVADEDLKASNAAINALGHFEGDLAVEQALLAKLGAARPEQRRALVRTLGKVGAAATVAALEGLDVGDDPELGRLTAQAKVILARRAGRVAVSEVVGDLAPMAPLTLHFHCRRGLEGFVIEELAALGVRATKAADGRVVARWTLPLAAAFGARCFDEVALAFPDGDPFRFLTAPATVALLTQLTRGPIRYRLDLGTDAERWALAARIAAACPALRNDPTKSTWELRLDGPTKTLELLPKRLTDPRFTYRTALVPASSHAPLAAALARLGGARADDVVWDPFCGAGNELIERAQLGPFKALIGTDLAPEALVAARANLAAAGLGDRATLTLGDCLTVLLSARPTLILSNPPLGRRVSKGEAEGLVAALIRRAQNLLAPGGRVVLVSPAPEESRAAALTAKLTITREQSVDMGGFVARIQVFEKAP